MLLSLDLGTHTGWSLWTAGRYLASGVWHLGRDKTRDRGDEFLLRVLGKVTAHKVTTIAYEHIASLHQHASADAAHLFGGWLMLLAIVAKRTNCKLQRVQQPEVYATSGIRKASPKAFPDAKLRREENKRRLVAAAQVRWPGVADDHEADACFVALAAMAQGTGAT